MMNFGLRAFREATKEFCVSLGAAAESVVLAFCGLEQVQGSIRATVIKLSTAELPSVWSQLTELLRILK